MRLFKSVTPQMVFEVAGMSSIVVGCFKIAEAAGFIAGGISLLLFTIASGRGRTN